MRDPATRLDSAHSGLRAGACALTSRRRAAIGMNPKWTYDADRSEATTRAGSAPRLVPARCWPSPRTIAARMGRVPVECESVRNGRARAVRDRSRARHRATAARTTKRRTSRSARSSITRTTPSRSIDPQTGRFLDVNERACRDHGYTRDEYLALTVPEIDPLMTMERWRELMENVRDAGSRVIESQHRRKDGSTFAVEINLTYIRLDREYLLAVVRDISEREAGRARPRRKPQPAPRRRRRHVGRGVRQGSRRPLPDDQHGRRAAARQDRGGGGRSERLGVVRAGGGEGGRRARSPGDCRRRAADVRGAAHRRGRDAHLPGDERRLSRRAGTGDRVDWRVPRRDGIEAAGGAAPSGAEDGSGRPAGRRHRARLQQPAHGDQRLRRSDLQPARPRRSEPRAARGSHEIRRARDAPHAAAAGVQPQAGAAAAGRQPECAAERAAQADGAADRRGHRADVRARRASSIS